eukprot:6197887-Pleurochrysis_carterae.AAC.1
MLTHAHARTRTNAPTHAHADARTCSSTFTLSYVLTHAHAGAAPSALACLSASLIACVGAAATPPACMQRKAAIAAADTGSEAAAAARSVCTVPLSNLTYTPCLASTTTSASSRSLAQKQPRSPRWGQNTSSHIVANRRSVNGHAASTAATARRRHGASRVSNLVSEIASVPTFTNARSALRLSFCWGSANRHAGIGDRAASSTASSDVDVKNK